jgi:hypothetical protein
MFGVRLKWPLLGALSWAVKKAAEMGEDIAAAADIAWKPFDGLHPT